MQEKKEGHNPSEGGAVGGASGQIAESLQNHRFSIQKYPGMKKTCVNEQEILNFDTFEQFDINKVLHQSATKIY